MSYGLKYTVTFRDEVLSNNLYKINIYASGYGGSAQSMICSGNPISLAYKKQDLISPILGSELTIGIMSTTNGEYLEFSNAAPLAYYADVLQSTNNGSSYSTYWSGVNTTDAYSEPYDNAPYAINLKFNCGLGELQFRRYENSGTLLNGNEQVILTIANCLSFLPYQKNVREIINIREDTMQDTSGLFEQLYINDLTFQENADDGAMHGKPCQAILNDVLTSLNCRMYQANNMWYIERIWERTHTSLTYFDYTPTGVMQNPPYTYSHIGTGSFDPRITINNASQPKLINGGDWQSTKKQPILFYNFPVNPETQELITNPYFEDTPTSTNANGTPMNWDLGANLSAANLTEGIVDPYSSDTKYRWGAIFDNQSIMNFNNAVKTVDIAHGYSPIGGNYGQYNGLNGYGIHAVRKPGDTYSNPNFYMDPANGNLQFDIRFFFSFKIKANSFPSMTQSIYQGGDAYNIINGSGTIWQIPFIFQIWQGSGLDWTLTGPYVDQYNGNGAAWQGNTGLAGVFGPDTIASYNLNFPSPAFTGQPVPLTVQQLGNMLQQSFISGQPFYLNFNPKYTFTMPLNNPTFLNGPGMYQFNVNILPPVITNLSAAGVYATNLQHTSLTLNQFGVNTCSVQYQDNFSNAVPFTKFYSSGDYDLRWTEAKVTPTYGDTIMPGYPYAFMIANSSPTGTWHVEGESFQFTFNKSTSGDPGSLNMSLNNTNPTLASNIIIHPFGSAQHTWITSMTVGQLIVVSDISDGLQYQFEIIGAPILLTGYYTIGVAYAGGSATPVNSAIVYSSPSGSFLQGETITGQTSGATATVNINNGVNVVTVYNISGTFSAGETIKGSTSHATATFSSIGGDTLEVVYQGGQNLADMLFQNYCGLIANYRRSIRGNILMNGGIGMWQSVVDEDGTLYAQTSNKFDFKKGMMAIDLEEVSAAPPTITKINQSQTKLQQQTIAMKYVPPPPVTGGTTTKVAISKTAVLNAAKQIIYPTE